MSEVVFFEGTIKRDNISFLVFRIRRNMEERRIEIPVEERIAQHVMSHLGRFVTPASKPVERGNDEESL